MLKYSPRQRELFLSMRGDHETVLAEGPVRTGKSLAMAAAYLTWSGGRYYGHRFLIASKSLTHIREAMMPELMRVADDVGVKVIPRYQEKALLIGKPPHFNRHIMMDFQSMASVGKIQGQTYAGAWINEAGLAPQEFISEAHARCASVPGSKVWLDTNPEGPRHWLVTEYMDEPQTASFKFRLRPTCDNPTLSERAVQRIERSYPEGSVQYKRKVLGLWEAATGLVYPNHILMIEPRPAEEPSGWELAVDGGIKTVTHASLFGHWPQRTWLAEEYRYDTRVMDVIADSQHALNIREMLGTRQLDRIVIDRFAQSLKTELSLVFPGVPIIEADNYPNSILSGIDLTTQWLHHKTIALDPIGAEHTLREFDLYEWDELAQLRGVTVPKKTADIHGLDVIRYWVVEANKTTEFEFAGAA